MPRPFEVEYDYFLSHLDEMVDVTFSDLQSQFLVLPKGSRFIEYSEFQDAYEVLKKFTALVSVAVQYISAGSPPSAENTVHRLNKIDTAHGLTSLQHVAAMHVPYATLL